MLSNPEKISLINRNISMRNVLLKSQRPTPVRPTSLLVSPNPLHQEPSAVKPQLDINKKVFEGRTSAAKESDSMLIEPPKSINLLNTNIIEKIDDRTNSYVNKVERYS